MSMWMKSFLAPAAGGLFKNLTLFQSSGGSCPEASAVAARVSKKSDSALRVKNNDSR